jgi:putative heme iron utilization protein
MVNPDVANVLRSLLETQRIASLGTLHEGEPYVSMAPFAVLPEGVFVIHVSALAAHTRDMLASPRVSLLVTAPPDAQTPAQAVARVTIQADAEALDESMPEHAPARAAYLARFPQSAQTFELSDFSLFALRPRSLRVVGGFAQAKTVTPEGLARALARRQ